MIRLRLGFILGGAVAMLACSNVAALAGFVNTFPLSLPTADQGLDGGWYKGNTCSDCSYTQKSAGAAAELALTGSSHITLQQEFTLTGTAPLDLSYTLTANNGNSFTFETIFTDLTHGGSGPVTAVHTTAGSFVDVVNSSGSPASFRSGDHIEVQFELLAHGSEEDRSHPDVTISRVSLVAAPGPIPGAGLFSYVALGLIGLGSMGWKRFRQPVVSLS
jgi:hypothetical protein